MAINKTEAGTWAVNFRGQQCACDKIQGPHRHRVEKTFDTHREAVAYEKEMAARVERKEFVKSSTQTVREVAGDWLKAKTDAGTYRRATLVSYRNHVENYIVPDLGHLRAREVSIQAVETAGAKWGKQVNPVMVNKVLTTLSAIFDRAKRHGVVRDNPASDAERLKIATEDEDSAEVAPDKVYSKAELKRLIEATEPGSFDRASIMVLAFCGLRVGEALGLKWSAVDLKENKIEIRLALADGDKGEQDLLQAPKTRTSRRTIPSLPAELIKELRLWRLRSPKSDLDLVFAREGGTPMHRNDVSHALDRAISQAKLEKRLTPHGLRHTFASLLLAAGVKAPEVSYLLGHKDCAITMKVYAHFVKEKESTAVANLGQSIMAGN